MQTSRTGKVSRLSAHILAYECILLKWRRAARLERKRRPSGVTIFRSRRALPRRGSQVSVHPSRTSWRGSDGLAYFLVAHSVPRRAARMTRVNESIVLASRRLSIWSRHRFGAVDRRPAASDLQCTRTRHRPRPPQDEPLQHQCRDRIATVV